MSVNSDPNNISAEYLNRFERSAGELLNHLRNRNPLEATLNARLLRDFMNNLKNINANQLHSRPQLLNNIKAINEIIEHENLNNEFEGVIQGINSLVIHSDNFRGRGTPNIRNQNTQLQNLIGNIDLGKINQLRNNPDLLKTFRIQDETKLFINTLFDGANAEIDKFLFGHLDINNVMEAFKKNLLGDNILILFSVKHLRDVKLENLSSREIKNFFPESLNAINKARFAYINIGQLINAFEKDLFTELNIIELISISQLSRFMSKNKGSKNILGGNKQSQLQQPKQPLANITRVSNDFVSKSDALPQNSSPNNYSDDHIKNCDILGVSYDATREEIRKAYKKLILQFHPDRNPASDAADKFNIIHQAYQELNG